MSDSAPGYFTDFLQSPANVTGLLTGVAAAVILSFPFGLLGAAFPLLLTAGIEVIACLFVPDTPSFRRWADEQRKARTRNENIARTLEEIRKRCAGQEKFRRYQEQFQAINEQVARLLSTAGERSDTLRLDDVDRIGEVPGEYLALHLSLLVMDERAKAVDLRDIDRKLRQLGAQIENPADGTDVEQLERAREEYAALLTRHQRMQGKRSAIEAALLTLPDQLAEIYQMVMADSAHRDSGRLSDAIASLRLRQDIESEIADDLSGISPIAETDRARAVRRAGAQTLH